MWAVELCGAQLHSAKKPGRMCVTGTPLRSNRRSLSQWLRADLLVASLTADICDMLTMEDTLASSAAWAKYVVASSMPGAIVKQKYAPRTPSMAERTEPKSSRSPTNISAPAAFSWSERSSLRRTNARTRWPLDSSIRVVSLPVAPHRCGHQEQLGGGHDEGTEAVSGLLVGEGKGAKGERDSEKRWRCCRTTNEVCTTGESIGSESKQVVSVELFSRASVQWRVARTADRACGRADS